MPRKRKKRLFGNLAGDTLDVTPRTTLGRGRKPSALYPAVYLDWLEQAATAGEITLTWPDGTRNLHGIVLELRRFCRTLVDEREVGAAFAAAVKILPPNTKAHSITIVRRDAALEGVKVTTRETPFVLPLGSVGRVDEISESLYNADNTNSGEEKDE